MPRMTRVQDQLAPVLEHSGAGEPSCTLHLDRRGRPRVVQADLGRGTPTRAAARRSRRPAAGLASSPSACRPVGGRSNPKTEWSFGMRLPVLQALLAYAHPPGQSCAAQR